MDCNIFDPVELPCGRTVENRLVKVVAMYEHMSNFSGGSPNEFHYGLYSEWAKHGWGMVLTGNVQVSPQHLTLGRDIVVPATLNAEDLKPFERLAEVIHGGVDGARSLAIMQLSHAGRQSARFIGGRSPFVAPLAPSPVRVGAGNPGAVRDVIADFVFHTLFQAPTEMTTQDILHVQSSFVRGSLLAYESGFDGVQVHAAHGYLLAQFMNPKSNIRNDEYSAAPENNIRMLHEIVEAIRKVVPTTFIIGIKINSADYVASGSTEEVSQQGEQCILDHIRTISSWGIIDFIEISGGDYEKPDFMASVGSQQSERQAFFAQFSQTVMKDLHRSPTPFSSIPLVLLTGGLRSHSHLQTALVSGHADLLGIGRGAVLCPDLPKILRSQLHNSKSPSTWADRPFAHEPAAVLGASKWLPNVKLVGAGFGSAWYIIRMRDIAVSQIKNPGAEPPPLDYDQGGLFAFFKMWAWFDFGRATVWILGISTALVVGFFCYH
ncbi:uncharacterized protein EDB91DRAFT_1043445 [Suillus paluster]|uniref:uncharacterized protein n=1 Tax=Suillus paluster TaxID=48578 RepID=UPI001B863752|nr:uncharacterized protein EDB91DRAFT_1043445 [Suillus paluster]KAG1753607.1 hypothetical protein EDB91DRAFT_1043445 [Suillus paluster]